MSEAPPTAAPVFVDPTGKRRRRVRLVAVAVAVSLLATGALVVVALLGVPIGPSAYLPEPVPPAPQVTDHPAPATDPSGGTGATTAGRRPAPRTPSEPAAPLSGPAAMVTTTAATVPTKGKPQTPPGRPTDLPPPPGHTH